MTNTEKIQADLRKLGQVLDADITAKYEGGDTYKNSFDEYMTVNEFGLALEVVCDYLVAEGAELIDSSRIMLIEELHTAMHVQDGCISELEGARLRASGISTKAGSPLNPS